MTNYDWKCRDGTEVECPACRGRGVRRYDIVRTCRICKGEGAVEERFAAEWAPDQN
jgi:DnaJ-class molecular chaperone